MDNKFKYSHYVFFKPLKLSNQFVSPGTQRITPVSVNSNIMNTITQTYSITAYNRQYALAVGQRKLREKKFKKSCFTAKCIFLFVQIISCKIFFLQRTMNYCQALIFNLQMKIQCFNNLK